MTERGRILVTGSRDWKQVDVIRVALRLAAVQLAGEAGRENAPVLVSGDAPNGADAQAEYIWEEEWGLEVERHPAQWDRDGRGAGFKRNEEMVNSLDKDRDVVLAFIRNGSNGATHTKDYAEARGYRVWVHRDDDREVDESVREEAAGFQPGAVGSDPGTQG